MKRKVYQSEKDEYIEMEILAKYKYIKDSWGISLTKNKIYDCVGYDEDGSLRIVDDTNEDYLYNPKEFELVKDYRKEGQ